MKRTILAVTALMALSVGGPTGAADLAPVYKAPPPPACANFGGFYGGGHIDTVQFNSYLVDQDGFLNRHSLATLGFSDIPGGYARSNDSWAGGFQVGWNLQMRCAVFGVVADGSWGRNTIDTSLHPNLVLTGVTQLSETLSSQLSWYGTLRGKTGIVVDNVMLYVTGGLAWAKFSHTGSYALTTVAGAAIGGPATFSSSVTFGDSKWGWVSGVGGEYALTSNISIFTELLYLSFQKRDYSVAENTPVNIGGIFGSSCPTGPGAAPFLGGSVGRCSFQTGENVIVARIGANWRFNWEQPVYAKY